MERQKRASAKGQRYRLKAGKYKKSSKFLDIFIFYYETDKKIRR